MNTAVTETRLPFAALLFAALLGLVNAPLPACAAAPSDSEVLAADPSTEGASATAGEPVAGEQDEASPPARELSVAPRDYPLYPSDRPEWIDQPGPQREGATVRWTIASIPMSSREASEAALRIQMRQALTQYAQQTLDPDVVVTPEAIDDAWIERYLADPARRYRGTFETSDGVMYEDAVQLVFEPGLQQELKSQVREIILPQRLRRLGVLGGVALLGMAGLSVLMRGASRLGRRPRT